MVEEFEALGLFKEVFDIFSRSFLIYRNLNSILS